jgi:hypothetical protein
MFYEYSRERFLMIGTESVWLVAGIGIGVIAGFAVMVFFSINTDIRARRRKSEADRALAEFIDRYGALRGLKYYQEKKGTLPPAAEAAANREIEAWIEDAAKHEQRIDAIFDGATV